MGGYTFRNVDVSASVASGRFFGDKVGSDERPVCEIREVSGLKPWELAKVRTGVKLESVEREEEAVEEFLEREERADEVLFEIGRVEEADEIEEVVKWFRESNVTFVGFEAVKK